MSSLTKKISNSLKELGFSRVELASSSGKVGGCVVDERFRGLTQMERQELLYEELETKLRLHDLCRISAILTMTPSEVD